MASNPTPDNPDVIFSLVQDMLDGLDTHATGIGILRNTKPVMLAALTAFETAENAVANAKATRGALAAGQVAKDAEVTAWLTKAANVLRIVLGTRWSTAWEATHFPDSKTQVPTSKDKRFTLVGRLATYFAAHPTHEAPNQGVTATAAATLNTQMSNCRDLLNQAETDQTAALEARDTALAAIRKRIRSLIDELGDFIGPEDPRWDAFGLSRPADGDTPEPATAFTVTQQGSSALLYKWKRARRATYYRLMVKIIGTDTDFRHQKPNTEGLSHLLENLTPGQTIEAHLIAANDTGEAEATATVSAVVA